LLAVSTRHHGVKVLDANYQPVMTIKGGLDDPDWLWYDPQGDLYVSSIRSNTVQEYARGATSPTFTYTTPTSDTHGIVTDAQGNVYIATAAAQIIEFPHRRNSPIAMCSIGASGANGAEGVAIDAAGDVFVSIAGSSSAAGSLFEFPGSLAGCSRVRLPVYMGGGGGLAIDAKQRLVAIDQQGAIDIIPPPYQKATRRRRFRGSEHGCERPTPGYPRGAMTAAGRSSRVAERSASLQRASIKPM
jgi:hypothetical protein